MNKQREGVAGCGLAKANTACVLPQLRPYCIFIALHIKVSTLTLGTVKIVIWLADVMNPLVTSDLFCLLILLYLYYISSPQDFHFPICSNIFSQRSILTRCYSNPTCRLVSLWAVCPFVKIKITTNSNLSVGLWTSEIKTAGRRRWKQARKRGAKPQPNPADPKDSRVVPEWADVTVFQKQIVF